jgi:hypothetical protein
MFSSHEFADCGQIFGPVHAMALAGGDGHVDGDVGFEQAELFQFFQPLQRTLAQSAEFFKDGACGSP